VSAENADPDYSFTGSVAGTSSPALLTDAVAVPRWAVYVQGILLGLVATTCFVFGLAVGNSTGGPSVGEDTGTCVISGTVYYDRDRERLADYGAVVLLLPADVQPRQRPPGAGLSPGQFEPVRNPALDEIRALGGGVVRVDRDGRFQTELPGDRSYWWLVISRHQQAASEDISKQTRAELGTWFLPIEDLLGDREFLWDKVRISGRQHALPPVTF
jgi:hypothetical protein